MEGVRFHDLYEAHPDFDIDVTTEQQLLLDHYVVVLHHLFYWYSAPALIEQWEDLVLTHGWAYRSGGCRAQRQVGLLTEPRASTGERGCGLHHREGQAILVRIWIAHRASVRAGDSFLLAKVPTSMRRSAQNGSRKAPG